MQMQPTPNLGEEGTLISKGHLGTLTVMETAKVKQGVLDFGWSFLTLAHVLVHHIQSLGGITHCLDT